MRRKMVVSSVWVVVLVSCSGSDGAAPAAVTDPPSSEPVTESVAATSGDEGTAETDTGPVGEFCDAAAALRDAEFEDDEVFGPDARRLLEDVRAAAPAGIAADVEFVVDTLDEVESIESEAPGPDDQQAFDRVLELIFSPEFEEASRSIEDYGVSECGFEPVQQP